jgi:hypothetical protein
MTTLPIVQRILNSAFSDHTKYQLHNYYSVMLLTTGLLATLRGPYRTNLSQLQYQKMLHLQDEVKTAREVANH